MSVLPVSVFSQAQKKITPVETDSIAPPQKKAYKNRYDSATKAHSPKVAAIRSALLPGLGQIYNKKYWKIPIVYAGLGTGIYFYADNNKKYHRFRDEYKKRLNGTADPDDPYFGNLDNSRIIDGQKFYQRNRDLSVLITTAIYILNIVDANVDAHLMQFNVNENLTLRPDYNQNEIDFKHNIGLTLNYQF